VCFFKICFDMGDDCPERLCQRAIFEARRQGHLQFLATLEAMGQGGVPAGGVDCFGGFEALSEPLQRVDWPRHFRLSTPALFNGSSDPFEFLQLYVIAVQAERGDQRVMANWFPMALKDAPRTWLMNLLHKSVTSWKDLCH
jgi:hypothetical protein